MKDTRQRDQDRDDTRGSEYCHQETVWKVRTYCLLRDHLLTNIQPVIKWGKTILEQESIPVGCIPPACADRSGGARGPCTVRSNVSWVMVTWDTPPPRWTSRHIWKHYPSAASLTVGNNHLLHNNNDNRFLTHDQLQTISNLMQFIQLFYCVYQD